MWLLAWAYDTPGRSSASRMARGMACSAPPAASTAASNLQGAREQGRAARPGRAGCGAAPLTGRGRRCHLDRTPVCPDPLAKLTGPGWHCSSACDHRAPRLQGATARINGEEPADGAVAGAAAPLGVGSPWAAARDGRCARSHIACSPSSTPASSSSALPWTPLRLMVQRAVYSLRVRIQQAQNVQQPG